MSIEKMTPGEQQLWCSLYAARVLYYWLKPDLLKHQSDKEGTAAREAAEYASVCVGGLRRHKDSIYDGWKGLATSFFTGQVLGDGLCSICGSVLKITGPFTHCPKCDKEQL